jgi:hypothetical protein
VYNFWEIKSRKEIAMNLRCMYCQTMFALSREEMVAALQTMEAEDLTHYDAHCPKCRRANRVERKKLELANPNWQETLKEMAKEAAKAEKAETKAEKPVSEAKATAASTEKKPAAKKTASRAKGK